MMIDILKCHQPNKDGIVKMMYRADFCGLQRLSKEAHENGDYNNERRYSQRAAVALHKSVDDNSFSRRWHTARG